jgi:hypothetical protein
MEVCLTVPRNAVKQDARLQDPSLTADSADSTDRQKQIRVICVIRGSNFTNLGSIASDFGFRIFLPPILDDYGDCATLRLVNSSNPQFASYFAAWYYFTSAADWCLRLP